MTLHANMYMTPDEQVAFAWKHREHFAECREHNLSNIPRAYRGETTLPYRNAWAELARLPDAKPYPPIALAA